MSTDGAEQEKSQQVHVDDKECGPSVTAAQAVARLRPLYNADTINVHQAEWLYSMDL